MNVRNARLWIRIRSRMIKGVKKNRSSAHRDDMTCRCCDSGEDETQEHLEVCAGTGNKQRGPEDWEKWQTRVMFWKRMTKKLAEREIEEMKKRKKEEKAQKRTRCEAET